MLFLFTSEIKPEQRNAVFARFKKIHEAVPEGVQLKGIWFSVTHNKAWGVAEAEDGFVLGKWFYRWTDLNADYITPVVEHDDMLKIIG